MGTLTTKTWLGRHHYAHFRDEVAEEMGGSQDGLPKRVLVRTYPGKEAAVKGILSFSCASYSVLPLGSGPLTVSQSQKEDKPSGAGLSERWLWTQRQRQELQRDFPADLGTYISLPEPQFFHL